MSLGVIAFSMSQQMCIEDELRRYRINHPEIDEFFNENKIEPFFVKNLETVQGDERAYIILSIGYGKDAEGKLTMNFGPLNRSGGYRRLNVAITRAKLNLKLVGSIMPDDFDLTKTVSRGIKLLHDYINFALKGPSVLPDIEASGNIMMTDSPFEKEVLSFLQDHNYLVDPQVGCSGFRIDLAIRDPENNGKYVLGIECDGASYHSARTARDRDRLRQEILEERGWKIYRIWSTDWVKDFPNETKKLLKAVSSAIESKEDLPILCIQPNIQKTVADIEIQNDVSVVEQYCEEIKSSPDNACDFYGFEPYTEIECQSSEGSKGLFSYTITISPRYEQSTYIKIFGFECPIHIDLLSKRVAYLYNRQKVTSVVEENVRRCLRILSDLILKKNNFIYLKEKDIKVRIPFDGKGIRIVEHIAPEELQLALLTIIRKQYGITIDQLIYETTHIFGFNRSGQKIYKALSDQVNFLISHKKITVEQNTNRIQIN